MEIFKLFGSIFVDNEGANQQIDETDQKGQGLAGTFGSMVGAAAQWGVAMAAAIGVVVVGAIGKGIMSAEELHKAMNGLQAQTGATDEEMQGMEESLKRIYENNYGESFEDIAQAMTNVKQATGLTGEELEKTTQNALMLRDTFGTEVNETVRAADQLMRQFGISSDEAMTLIAQGFQGGLDKSGDFLDTINEYSVYFETLGYDTEGFFNTLSAGSEAGAFNLDKIADVMKEFGIRTKDMSDSSKEGFESLGMNADAMFAQFAKGGDAAKQATEQVFQALGNIEDPLLRNTIGVQLMGTQFEDLEAETILALGNIEDKFNSTGDTLNKINEIKYDSFSEAMTGVGRQIQVGMLMPIGEKLLPLLNDFANWLSSKMPEIEAFVTDAFTGSGDVLKAFGEVFNWLKDSIIIPIFNALVPFVQENLEKLKVFWDENGAQIKQIVSTVFGAIKETINTIMPIITSIISTSLNTTMGVIKLFTGLLTGDWKKAWNGAKDIVSSIFGGIVSIVKSSINVVIKAFNGMIRSLNSFEFSVPDWVPGMGGKGWSPSIPSIPYLAKGTDFFAGGMAIVGEEGPELVNLPRGSQVIPNNRTEDLLKTPEYIVVEVNLDGQKMAQVLAKPMSFELGQHTRGRGRGAGVIMP